jgi:hypothetical protein
VACMKEGRGVYWLFGGETSGQKGHLEEVHANWRIITYLCRNIHNTVNLCLSTVNILEF